MKKLSLIAIACVCIFFLTNAHAQSTVSETKIFKSSVLNRDVNYSIYLPTGYSTSDRAYPVLYLLHGMWGDHTDWIRNGDVQAITDRSIADGKSIDMIIVMPDARNDWYANSADGRNPYEDMFIKELIPHIESTYRVIAEKDSRAIAGLSMGGYGTLMYTLRYPGIFTASCPMSAGVFTADEIQNMKKDPQDAEFKKIFGITAKSDMKYWAQYDVLELIKNLPQADRKKVKIYAYCGDDDFLFRGNAALWVALVEAKVPSEFRVWDGGHTWTFWRTALEEILPVVSRHFHRF